MYKLYIVICCDVCTPSDLALRTFWSVSRKIPADYSGVNECSCCWFQSYQSIERDHSLHQITQAGRYHFAMSGKSFAIIKQYFPDIFQKVISRAIFTDWSCPECVPVWIRFCSAILEMTYNTSRCVDSRPWVDLHCRCCYLANRLAVSENERIIANYIIHYGFPQTIEDTARKMRQ